MQNMQTRKSFFLFSTIFLVFALVFGGLSCSSSNRTFKSIGKMPRFAITLTVMNSDSHRFFSEKQPVTVKVSISPIGKEGEAEEAALFWIESFRSIQIYRRGGCKGRPLKILSQILKEENSYTLSLKGLTEGVYSFKFLTSFQKKEEPKEDSPAEENPVNKESSYEYDEAEGKGEGEGEDDEGKNKKAKNNQLQFSKCSENVFLDTNAPSSVVVTSSVWDDITLESVDLQWQKAKEKGKVQSGVDSYQLSIYKTDQCQGEPHKTIHGIKQNSYFIPSVELGTTYSFTVIPKDKVGNQPKRARCSRSVRRVTCLPADSLRERPAQTQTRKVAAQNKWDKKTCVANSVSGNGEWGNWEFDRCVDDYHLEGRPGNQTCVSNTRNCPSDSHHPMPARALTATQEWSASGSSQWEPCSATSCDANYKKVNGTCQKSAKGYYVNKNVQYSCFPSDSDPNTNAEDESAAELSRRGGTDWIAVQPSTVTRRADCKLEGCVADDKIFNTAKTGCVDLPSGHYKKSDHTSESCGTVPTSSTGWTDPQPSSVASKVSCLFDCASGRTASSTKGESGTCDIKPGHVSKGGPSSNNAATQCKGGTVSNSAQTACQNPAKGHYSKDGVETPCSPAKEHSTFAENTGGLSTDACPFVCDENYGLNADESACITCGVGQYLDLLKGTCRGVSPGYVSKAYTLTQTECTGNTIPNSDKSVCVSNACPSSKAITKGVGQLLVDGGDCTLVSCEGGYYEDFHNNPGKCTQIPADSGIYSPANDKQYSECSDSVTLPSYAHWKHLAGIDSSAGCTWACGTGHKPNSGKTGCDIKETLTQIALECK